MGDTYVYEQAQIERFNQAVRDLQPGDTVSWKAGEREAGTGYFDAWCALPGRAWIYRDGATFSIGIDSIVYVNTLTRKRPTCPSCRTPEGEAHKMSCTLGGSKAAAPVEQPDDEPDTCAVGSAPVEPATEADLLTPEQLAELGPLAAKLEAAQRKGRPVARGVLDYFPDALQAVAELSRIGNEQHNAGQPLHWAYDKSTDHADCLVRHLIDRGVKDSDGVSHTVKVAWRALALLQTELEKADPELHKRREWLREKASKGER